MMPEIKLLITFCIPNPIPTDKPPRTQPSFSSFNPKIEVVIIKIINKLIYPIMETMEFFKAQMKRNIESNPNLTREQKDNEISVRESWYNALKASMGL